MNIIHHVNYKGNHQRKIPSVFSKELWNCSLPNCTVNYCSLQTKSSTDWKLAAVIWRFSGKFKLNIIDGITDGLKNRRWYFVVCEKFWLNWKFKLNITDGITDGMIKNININYPFVKPSVKRLNKKPRILNFTTDGALLFFFFFFFPICKKHQYPFLSLIFSPQFLLFSSMIRYVLFSFLLFSSQFF